MKIVKNEGLIQRNARISSIITLASLAILGVGMYITFSRPELINWSLIALLVGFLLSQVGIYMTNRWGRKPRPDDVLDKSLKGLDKRYTLYHYTAPAAHLLIGPAGIWVLVPKHQRGTISYRKNRWRQKGGGIFLAYLKTFAQEGIGRPDLEMASEVDGVLKWFKKHLPAQDIPSVQSALVFFHPDVEIDAEGAPAPTLPAKKLKDFIRKQAKEKPLSEETITQLNGLFEQG